MPSSGLCAILGFMIDNPANADDAVALNRAMWETRARVHGSTAPDRFSDVESVVAGRGTLHRLGRERGGGGAG
ncbi:hypothetical protein, partial [Streptomyces yangpuensis]|uniref:hypothetical protein n=1 Tax=Streptomyces yangpuensis TaxID=1648182 RepID=UPI0036563D94